MRVLLMRVPSSAVTSGGVWISRGRRPFLRRSRSSSVSRLSRRFRKEPRSSGAQEFGVGRVAPRLLRESGRRETDEDVAVAGAVVAGGLERLLQEGTVAVVDRRERAGDDGDPFVPGHIPRRGRSYV